MNPRNTALLLLAVLGLGAFLYFYEIGGESARLDAEERGKRLFAGIEPGDVSWIVLRTSDGADARFEQRDGKWQLVAPLAFPADPGLARMAEALVAITPEKTFEKPQPDAEYGLDDAKAKIVRFGTAGAEHELRIGATTPVGANVYARTGDSPAVHTIASHRATAFTKSLTDLRDKQIVSFDPNAIGEVEVRWPGGRVVMARAAGSGDAPKPDAPAAPEPDGEWQMSVPLAARADGDAIDNLLSTLSFLRADAFVDAPSDAQRKLLAPADFEVVLKNRDAAQPAIQLVVGRPDGERRPVQAAGRDVLYEIAATRISDFPRSAVAYRERHLARFPATDAQQLDFYFHGKDGDPVAIRAERSGDAGWTSSPEKFASGRLSEVVSELSRLQAAEILAESMGEKELEKLGLSPPNAIITVLGAPPPSGKAPGEANKEEGGEPLPPAAPRLAEIHLGNVTPKGVAARAVGDPIVYRIDLETAERLPVSLDAFSSRFKEQAAPAVPAPSPEDPGTAPPPPGEDSP
jgi:Domain of unknown function (DUF4340)